MKTKLLILISLFYLKVSAQSVAGVDTLLKSGPISKRINLVILGDGYTASQTSKLISDATSTSNYLLGLSPFVNYKDYFNVFVIKCVSTQSGVTHPGTATDVSEPASPVVSVINYFNTSFDNFNHHRSLYSNNTSDVYSVLSANFPAYNQIVMLANSTEYGGTGGQVACSSMHSSAKEILAHEIGHSFAGLADEYWAGTIHAYERPNMTANSNSVTIKWSQWLGTNLTGIYAYGANSPENTWFKPHQNCKMQFLNRPFCSVCKQTIIERIHSLTNPIDNYYPSNASTLTFTSSSQWFKTDLIKPNPNSLKTIWDLNSSNISDNTDSVLLNRSSLIAGSNSLKVTVVDTTILSRDINHVLLHSFSVIWNINNSTTGTIEIKPQMEYSIFPNPASNFINLKYHLKEEASIIVSVIDTRGKKVISRNQSKQNAGDYLNEINVEELNSGTYFLSIQINGKTFNNQFVVFK
jgi:hypothetical protein